MRWSGHPNIPKPLPKYSFCSRMHRHLRAFRKTHLVHNVALIHFTILLTSLNTFLYYLLHHCPFLHTSEPRCWMFHRPFFLVLHISLSKKSLFLLTCSLISGLGLILNFHRKDTHHQGLFIPGDEHNVPVIFLIKKGTFKSQELQSHLKLWID